MINYFDNANKKEKKGIFKCEKVNKDSIYKDMDKQIKLMQKDIKSVLSEQEKQRIASLNIYELVAEMQENLAYAVDKIDEISKIIDK